MIELLATCLIAAGTTFTVPAGWTADEVGASGTRSVCSAGGSCLSMMVYPIDTTYIRLRRQIAVDELVRPPHGCTLEVRRRP